MSTSPVALPITHPVGHLEQILRVMDAARGRIPTVVVQHTFEFFIEERRMAVVQLAITAGLPYTTLRDSIITHPTLAEGLVSLFSAVPALT